MIKLEQTNYGGWQCLVDDVFIGKTSIFEPSKSKLLIEALKILGIEVQTITYWPSATKTEDKKVIVSKVTRIDSNMNPSAIIVEDI